MTLIEPQRHGGAENNLRLRSSKSQISYLKFHSNVFSVSLCLCGYEMDLSEGQRLNGSG